MVATGEVCSSQCRHYGWLFDQFVVLILFGLGLLEYFLFPEVFALLQPDNRPEIYDQIRLFDVF